MSIHILAENHHWEKLWDWLGDREVFFCDQEYNVFSNSINKMLECFELLHYTNGVVFWRLYKDAQEKGMYDPMGAFLDMIETMEDDEVGVFSMWEEDLTQSNDFGEADLIEQWKKVPLSWWNNNKYEKNIRQLVAAV